VVTEGTLTEPLYVEGLSSYLRNAGATAIVKTIPVGKVGKDPMKVVKKCIEIRDKASEEKHYDICVCLVDVDQHSELKAACTLAASEEILLLVSNLKFEVWLRWHVEEKRSQLSTTQLDRLVATLELVTKKRLSTHFPFEGVYQACDVARRADPDLEAGRIGPNPSSAMPILVDLMLGR